MTPAKLEWYALRLSRMSPSEVSWRLRDELRRRQWAIRRARSGTRPVERSASADRKFVGRLPLGTRDSVPADLRSALIDAADLLLSGRWPIFGVWRDDFAQPDWFLDPTTGVRAPQEMLAFRIDLRSELETGNIKQVWEPSRHQHLTVLAAAWFVSRDDRYAEMVAEQLRSWWEENPFLSGVHWTSGIEIGLRLISWVWIRRLLDDWQGVADLFEANQAARSQVFWHQDYLAAFTSRGSSANNHVIAELAGQVIASCSFPWFPESEPWRASAAALLERELLHNTFPSGVNRELASDYHGFVTELGLLAAVESEVCGHPLGRATWQLLFQMVDAAAALLDETGRAPRQGDSDEGRGIVVDPPEVDRWSSLLASGKALMGSSPWWPEVAPTVLSTLLESMSSLSPVAFPKSRERPSHFADAGLTLLRSADNGRPEIWCRCDGGPHGYLSIAAHAHADSLALEVRHGGVDVLCDPGTFCYHDHPDWRRYFRSTLAHNTVEIGGLDQSKSGGPFLWLRQARSTVLTAECDERTGIQRWAAEHDGYRSLDPPALHRRTVSLEPQSRRLEIVDTVETTGSHGVRMPLHLGPAVRLELDGVVASLSWGPASAPGSAVMTLPSTLSWTVFRGATKPILGWYSNHFGVKEPTTTLMGTGSCEDGGLEWNTIIQFSD